MPSTTRRPEARTLAIAGGALALALALALLLKPGEAPNNKAPALPAPPPPAPVDAPAPSAPAPPSVEGLRLHGLLGGGAIIASADGRQHYFAIGREVAPGLRVARIEAQAVILASSGGELHLGFDGAGAQPAASPGQAPTESSEEERLRDETISYRIGLTPRRAGGRIAGFAVRPGVSLPALERAGLRPGDVILSVNGSRFDEERMLELAWEMRNASRTEFEIERGGRRMRLVMPARP